MHCIIHYNVKAPVYTKKLPKFIHDHRSPDFIAINSELEKFIADYVPSSQIWSVKQNWTLFKEKVSLTITEHSPPKMYLTEF